MDLESYTTTYSQTHPAPTFDRLSPLNDWRFWLLVLVVSGGILVSGIRTQAAFLDLARVSDLAWLPLLESVAAALVSEVGIAAFIVEGVQRRARGQPLGWVYIGLGVCFTISASANFDQGLKVRYPGGMVPGLDWGLGHVALLSVGIPVIVALAAEALGQYLAALTRQNEARYQAWEEAMTAWRRSLQASWMVQQRRNKLTAQEPHESSHRPPEAHSVRPLDGRPTPSGNLPPWLRTHLATIGRQLADGDGNGSFQRKDLEAWLGVRSSQANNVLKQGEAHGYVARRPGNRYQLTSFAELALAAAREQNPQTEERT